MDTPNAALAKVHSTIAPRALETSAATSKSSDAFCGACPFDRPPTNARFAYCVESTSLERKGYDEVAGERPLRTLRSSAERRGVVPRRVVTNLRPDHQDFVLFRDRKIDGECEGQRAVDGRPGDPCHNPWINIVDAGCT